MTWVARPPVARWGARGEGGGSGHGSGHGHGHGHGYQGSVIHLFGFNRSLVYVMEVQESGHIYPAESPIFTRDSRVVLLRGQLVMGGFLANPTADGTRKRELIDTPFGSSLPKTQPKYERGKNAMRNARPIQVLSSMTAVAFLAICVTVGFAGYIQAEVAHDDIRVPVVSWTPTNTYSAMTQSPPGMQIGSTTNPQTKQLPDYEPLDRDEFLGQVESAMATRGFSERIDHFSGSLHLNQVDLVLPGNAGLDIVIQHYYSSNVWNRVDNSLLTRHVPSADLSGRLGGNGWQLHMGKLMNVSPGLDSFTSLILPDGSNHTLYSRDGHLGEKITPEGWISTVDGSVHTVQTTTGLRYHFDSAASGAQYTYLGFDGANPIQILQCTRIEDLNGNAIVIEYSPGPANPTYESRIDRISFDDATDLREVVFSYHPNSVILDTMQLKNDSTAIETWTFTYHGPPYEAFQPQFGGSTVFVYPLANVVHSITGDYANERITNAWQL